jgi:AbrB family looped-hinge helix DNA binding protein
MKKIVTIRDRGQMTLPSKFRDEFQWLDSGNAVELEVVGDGGAVIVRPVGGANTYKSEETKPEQVGSQDSKVDSKTDSKKDWSKFQAGIEKLRKSGKDMGDVKEYLIQERKI